ncbi:MAG: hypothetical protein A2854_03270 [Parcubacteria group bacterium RIFCSPHIGHO2_01_FULL_56_18]|nr:MAG: hypothetical protein A2854_03270 [Parcubacteria group bacterium RIFCSPHIGHO2_01_FULL_56_18]
MRRIVQQSRFRRDYKLQKRRGKDIKKLKAVVLELAEYGILDILHRPHKLTGEWNGFWECHIEPNWLLIYDVNGDEVLLARTGTHSDLFGK